jgi:hypothetical protein
MVNVHPMFQNTNWAPLPSIGGGAASSASGIPAAPPPFIPPSDGTLPGDPGTPGGRPLIPGDPRFGDPITPIQPIQPIPPRQQQPIIPTDDFGGFDPGYFDDPSEGGGSSPSSLAGMNWNGQFMDQEIKDGWNPWAVRGVAAALSPFLPFGLSGIGGAAIIKGGQGQRDANLEAKNAIREQFGLLIPEADKRSWNAEVIMEDIWRELAAQTDYTADDRQGGTYETSLAGMQGDTGGLMATAMERAGQNIQSTHEMAAQASAARSQATQERGRAALELAFGTPGSVSSNNAAGDRSAMAAAAQNFELGAGDFNTFEPAYTDYGFSGSLDDSWQPDI